METNELIEKIRSLQIIFREQYELRREQEINAISPYSNEINKYIRRPEELEIYKRCNLTETVITRRTLVFPVDISYKYGGGITLKKQVLPLRPPL